MSPSRPLRIVLLSPRGPLYRHRGGIWKKTMRYAPLTLTTLASLGQLAPLGVFRAAHASDTYLTRAMRAGQRAGDVKPLALDRHTGWSQVFEGRYI